MCRLPKRQLYTDRVILNCFGPSRRSRGGVFTAASLHSIERAEDDATSASLSGREMRSVVTPLQLTEPASADQEVFSCLRSHFKVTLRRSIAFQKATC
jgi:hypothetical protein